VIRVLLRIIAFLGALAIAAAGELFPNTLPPRPWTWGPALLLGLAGLRWLGFQDSSGKTTRAQVLFLWVVLTTVIHLLGWARWVLLDLGWQGSPFASFVLLLAPLAALSPGLRGAMRVFAALAVVPAMVLVAIELAWRLPALVETVQSAASLQVLAISAAVAVALPAAPFLVLLAISSQPLPQAALRSVLDGWSRKLGVRLRAIRVFGAETRSQLNACAVGFLPGTRRVFFTQGLVRLLDEERLAAVFCHEIAHFARGHFSVYALLVASFLLSLAPLLQATDSLSEAFAAAILLTYAALFWGLLHGVISRRLETDADLTAAGVVGFDLYASTLAWTGASQGQAAHVRGHRHQSLAAREQLIQDCGRNSGLLARELDLTRRLKRRVKGLAVLCAAAFLTCAAVDALRARGTVAALEAEVALARAAELLPALEHASSPARSVPRWLSWAARPRSSIAREVATHLDRAQARLQEAAAREAPAAGDLRRRLEGLRGVSR
jgi:Zn-dependent protease with chaperone function